MLPDIAVPMSDGVLLAADLLLPAGDGPFPTLLQRVPYDRGAPAIRDGALDTWKAVRHGYVVIIQDCRGRFGSAGEFLPFVNEAADGADTIAWIRRQPWSDGTVGMFGRSYSALLQWQVAAHKPDGLRAIAPMFSGVDPVTGWFGRGRSLEWGFLSMWALRHLAADALRRTGDADAASAAVRIGENIDAVLAETDGDKDVALVRAALPWLDQWLADETRDAAFDRISAAMAPAQAVEVPALVIAGWYDLFLRGTLRAFAVDPSDQHSLVVGPWPHGGTNPGVFPELGFGPAASGDAVGLTQRQLTWFDRWLRGRDVSTSPRVTWFQRGSGWQSGPAWPPAGVSTTSWHLAPDGRLADRAPSSARLELTYDAAQAAPTIGGATFLPGLEVAANAGPRDQRELLSREDVLAWKTEPLTADLEATGAAGCELDLVAAPGTRVVARLVELMPDDRAMLVTDGNAVVAEPSTAGSVHLAIELGPLAWTFPAGSRIALLLSNTSVPRHRRWPGDRRDGGLPETGTITLVVGAQSLLRLGGSHP